MKYEYEGYIKNTIRTEAVFSHEIEQKYDRILELEEVYRKACAFDRIAEVHSDNDHYSDEYVMETIQEQIDLMERTDDER